MEYDEGETDLQAKWKAKTTKTIIDINFTILVCRNEFSIHTANFNSKLGKWTNINAMNVFLSACGQQSIHIKCNRIYYALSLKTTGTLW